MLRPVYSVTGVERPMRFPSVSRIIAISPTPGIAVMGRAIVLPSISTLETAASISSTCTKSRIGSSSCRLDKPPEFSVPGLSALW